MLEDEESSLDVLHPDPALQHPSLDQTVAAAVPRRRQAPGRMRVRTWWMLTFSTAATAAIVRYSTG
jgi:hypothetical protein